MNTCKADLEVKSLKTIIAVADRMTRKSHKNDVKNVSISLNGSAVIRWNDIESTVQVSIPCEHDGADRTIIAPAGEILQILKNTKSKRIQIETESESESTFTSGSISRRLEPNTSLSSVTNAKMETTVEHTVREIPQINFYGERICIDADDFRRSVKALMHAVDTDCSRYALGGICMEFANNGMKMVATDARRLAIRTLVTGGDYRCGINVPMAALKTFLDLMPKKLDGQVVIFLRETEDKLSYTITLNWEDISVQTPEIQGRFPKYQDAVPACENSAFIDRLAMLEIMEEIGNSQEKDQRGIDFKLASDLLTVRGTGVNKNSIRHLSICCPGHVKITLDPQYVADALKSIDSPEIMMEFNDGLTPIIIRSPIPGIHTEAIMPLSRD